MYPIGSNGASQAILDADALAANVGQTSDIPEAVKRYEQARLAPTAALVRINRQQGPEQVMQIVEDRAPDGFKRLEDVISQQELAEIAKRYKVVAGFDKDRLTAYAPK
jgi:2-polyprenyl-6-methoxyphenol hydroxylase-like FAD-dependent oxidoreductase